MIVSYRSFLSTRAFWLKMLHVHSVCHSFGSYQLGPLNLSLGEGLCVGLFGRNGAGKSTFFNILTGHIKPLSGVVSFLGEKVEDDNHSQKRHMGYLPQDQRLPNYATPRQLITYAGQLFGVPEHTPQVMELWEITGYQDKPIQSLSYGMQKRVGLALAWIHDPPFLILDEPHSGLDFFQIQTLDKKILQRKAEGKTTLMSTHILGHAVTFCDRLYLLHGGQLEVLKNEKDPLDMDLITETLWKRQEKP